MQPHQFGRALVHLLSQPEIRIGGIPFHAQEHTKSPAENRIDAVKVRIDYSAWQRMECCAAQLALRDGFPVSSLAENRLAL
jgi:hypothetical protein